MNNVSRVTRDTWGVFAPSHAVVAAVVIQATGSDTFQVLQLAPVNGLIATVAVVQSGLTWDAAEALAAKKADRLAQGVA